MELTYGNYCITDVYGRTDVALRRELVAFWLRNRAIADRGEAERRTREVVFTIRNREDSIVGVCTVYVARFAGRRSCYYYRMFIQPADRVYGMMRVVTVATRDYLRALEVPDKPHGLVIVTENPKLMRKGMRRVLERIGFERVSRTPQGFDVWKSEF